MRRRLAREASVTFHASMTRRPDFAGTRKRAWVIGEDSRVITDIACITRRAAAGLAFSAFTGRRIALEVAGSTDRPTSSTGNEMAAETGTHIMTAAAMYGCCCC
jgi:hypothetical protein